MGPIDRLSKVLDTFTGGGAVQNPNELPWNPDSARFPSRSELPKIPGAPDDAAWVWGKDDQAPKPSTSTTTTQRLIYSRLAG
jgi:hypothetical protein